MKQLSTIALRLGFALFCFAKMQAAFGQKQLELISHLDYVSLANDVWGYTAPDGTEYALVGLRSGVSIVSLADPANPVELQLIPGDQSTWRDLKTWGHHAYVTADQPGTDEGLLIIDLSNLPGTVTWTNWRPVLPGAADSLFTCHNLWIDAEGYCYLSGCEQNSGGPIILDVHSTPGLPQFVGYSPATYAHDCFAQNGLLYTAEIYQGTFSVLDISDRTAPVLLATQSTPFEFCHNVWPNADGSVLFTTDERSNAPTAAYDLSNLGNVRLLDEFRPIATLNTGVIPHNAHAIGNYVVISNYTDGCVVVDATRPTNLIEVESYDTSTDFAEGFHGCWGAYPYFPSGLIAATDIENGLFILKPSYPRVAYLEGTVTDAESGQPIAEGQVSILSQDANFATTNPIGKYQTGQATPGSFSVLYRARGYYDSITEVQLEAGNVTQVDIGLQALPSYSLSGVVKDISTKEIIAGASVLLENQDFSYEVTANSLGVFELPAVKEGTYRLSVGSWGHRCLSLEQPMLADEDIELFLATGYDDDFNNDLGWTVEGTATNGLWERGQPIGIFAGGKQFTPATDSPNDPGNRAYLTGNSGGNVHTDQVDNGQTRLSSPPMLLRSRLNRPMLAFDFWFLNANSNNAADDSLTFSISNGSTEAVLAILATDSANVQAWTSSDTFDLARYLPITDNMRLHLAASDRAASPNVVEAGLDHFRIWEGLPDELFTTSDDLAKFRLYPNPFGNELTLDYKLETNAQSFNLLIFNPLGQLLQKTRHDGPAIGTLHLDLSDWSAGTYFVAFEVAGKLSEAGRVVKRG